MGLQKYRADEPGEPDARGACPWYTRWMGGPTIALIRNCPTPFGPRTVYIKGEADTFFSLPAKCRVGKVTYHGYVTCQDGMWEFHVPKKEGDHGKV